MAYVGSDDGMERELVRRESDLPLHTIPSAALRGRNPLTAARNLATIARGTAAARALLRRETPAAILGTGGYVCVPLFLAARAAGIPTIIYLPDVVPGLAVQLLSRLATVVACNVEDSLPYLKRTSANTKRELRNQQSAVVITGYPVRSDLFGQDKAACRAVFGLNDDLPTVFVYGGSRGARSINQAIAALLPSLLPDAQVVHVCGREGDESFLREAAATLPGALQARYKLFPYLFSGADASGDTPTMTRAFGAADLAVCRSGASTMAELPAAALPGVLVPYPYVHQEENADYLVRRGAAVKVDDGTMLGAGAPDDGPLLHAIRHLLSHPEERSRMSERSHTLARPNAAGHLAQLLLDLAARRSPA